VASGTVAQAKETLDYYQRYAESDCGWTPTSANRGLAREFYIAPTKAEIDEQFETVFRRDNEQAYDRVFHHPRLEELQREKYTPRSFAYRTQPRSARAGRTLRGMEGGAYLIGDPDSLTEQILEQRQECDAGVLIIRPEMGHMSLDEVANRLELFAREVLPTVQKA
jgi:alkanesulfonate monooxygenase SsuD/methylene tetrahydromethanopterin reductase-like flavin-dependent oxidoreductase (luciferase family)